MKRWTISVPDDMAAEVMAELDWGDSRSAWVRDAIDMKLASDAEPDADTLPDPLAAAIDAWQPEGDVATQTARTALREAVTWLRGHEGPAKKAAIVAGAKPADVSEQQWWARAARPGLAALAERGLVERPTTKTYAIEEE